ncbi:MAG: hypothetical protein HQL82_11475 [Magnetococcales bacterium]|nr:hypothetical protein [Magnetococcales bacterium]
MKNTLRTDDNGRRERGWAARVGGGPAERQEGGMVESRVARLEAAVEHIQTDLADLKTEFRDFRTETHAEFRNFRTETQSEFRNFRSETQSEFREMRIEFRDSRRILWRMFVFTWTMMIGFGAGIGGMMARKFGWW